MVAVWFTGITDHSLPSGHVTPFHIQYKTWQRFISLCLSCPLCYCCPKFYFYTYYKAHTTLLGKFIFWFSLFLYKQGLLKLKEINRKCLQNISFFPFLSLFKSLSFSGSFPCSWSFPQHRYLLGMLCSSAPLWLGHDNQWCYQPLQAPEPMAGVANTFQWHPFQKILTFQLMSPASPAP